MPAVKTPPVFLQVHPIAPDTPVFDVSHAHIHAHFVFRNETEKRWERFDRYQRNPEPGKFYSDLRVECSISNDDGISSHSYAWGVVYKPHAVEYWRAMAMSKTLKRIYDQLEKLDKDLGNPQTYGAFVARVAQTVAAKKVLLPSTPQQREFTDEEWIPYAPGDAVRRIDEMVMELRQKCIDKVRVGAFY